MAKTVTVKVNGDIVKFPDQQPEIDEAAGRVSVPLRGLFEGHLGFGVEWEGKTKTVTIEKIGDKIKFVIGINEYEITKNGEKESRVLDVAPYINNSRTMLSIRDPLEIMGYTVDWDEKKKDVLIIGGMEFEVRVYTNDRISDINEENVYKTIKSKIVKGKIFVKFYDFLDILKLDYKAMPMPEPGPENINYPHELYGIGSFILDINGFCDLEYIYEMFNGIKSFNKLVEYDGNKKIYKFWKQKKLTDGKEIEFHNSYNGDSDIKYFVADPKYICIEPSYDETPDTWADKGIFGTNASFFALYDKSGFDSQTEKSDLENYFENINPVGRMTVLHINNNKDMGPVLRGDINKIKENMESLVDVMYFNGKNVKIRKKVLRHSDISDDIKWGIGGHDLHVGDKSINNIKTLKEMYQKYYINSEGEPYHDIINIDDTFLLQHPERTVIGYNSKINKIYLVVDLKVGNRGNMYDMKKLMEEMGCTSALCLDGGSCTRISFPFGKKYECREPNRHCWCRIRIVPEANDKIDWDFN